MTRVPKSERTVDSRRFWGRWFLFFAFWASSLYWLGLRDLELSQKISNPDDPFGLFINDWGGIPCWPVLFWALIECLRRRTPLAQAIIAQGLIQGLLITHFLKRGWGRCRPNGLGVEFSEYSPFYLPAGPGCGESFPSGHVATGMVLAPIPFYLWRKGEYLASFSVFLTLAFYWLALGYGRVRFGVHYPTDCLFSIGLGVLLAPLLLTPKRVSK